MRGIDKALLLQQKYEYGELNISDMTEDEYRNIEKIYSIQIYQLDNEIKKHQKKIEECRKDILKIKKSK